MALRTDHKSEKRGFLSIENNDRAKMSQDLSQEAFTFTICISLNNLFLNAAQSTHYNTELQTHK